MREMSVTEQRYKAVLAVIADGRTVTQVARDWEVARQTVHVWLERYEADGLEGLANRSHRPAHCPHQMPAAVEALLLEMRRAKPYWGARRLVLELARKGIQPAPSKSAVYRSLVRAGVIDPLQRQRRRETWKRWERAAPMELWQLDIVHGFLLAYGTSAKALTGVDDHSRYCVSGQLMAAGLLRPGCSAYLQNRQEVGMLPPDATILGEDGTGDGHGAIALSGGVPGAFLISSPPVGPAHARWDFTMPFVDQPTTDDVVEFNGSRLAARGWTSAPDSMPHDWTWRLGDLKFRLNTPQSGGVSRGKSFVSWTRRWEIN